jgi:hypothetical protein
VLPANPGASVEPVSLNSLDNNTSRRSRNVNEQDLVMEDLDKVSPSSGGVTAVSI